MSDDVLFPCERCGADGAEMLAVRHRPSCPLANIDVQADHGDDGLAPGHYAAIDGHIAGPAESRDLARDAIVLYMLTEGYLMPDEEPEVHCWKARAPRRPLETRQP